MFSEAEPFTENSLGETSLGSSAGSSSAASTAPAREDGAAPVVIPVHESAAPAGMNGEPAGGAQPQNGAAEIPAQPSESAPQETSPVAAGAAAGEPGTPSAEELSELMDQYAAPHQEAPTEGEIVEGKVIAVTDLGVVVDFGRKSEGLVPAEEFIEAEQAIQFGPGQTIEVQITGEHKDGYAILSHQRARRRKRVGGPRKGLPRQENHQSESCGPREGRPGGGCGRTCVPAGIASRPAAGARHRGLERSRSSKCA